MIMVREAVRMIFVYLARMLNFNRMPAAFFIRSQVMLENIFSAYERNGQRLVLVKKGFYLFNGDDMVVYSHWLSQAVRLEMADTRWVRVTDVSEEERRLIGYDEDNDFMFDGDGFLAFLRQYLEDQSLSPDSYVTLFDCHRLHGLLVSQVMETLRFREALASSTSCE